MVYLSYPIFEICAWSFYEFGQLFQVEKRIEIEIAEVTSESRILLSTNLLSVHSKHGIRKKE